LARLTESFLCRGRGGGVGVDRLVPKEQVAGEKESSPRKRIACRKGKTWRGLTCGNREGGSKDPQKGECGGAISKGERDACGPPPSRGEIDAEEGALVLCSGGLARSQEGYKLVDPIGRRLLKSRKKVFSQPERAFSRKGNHKRAGGSLPGSGERGGSIRKKLKSIPLVEEGKIYNFEIDRGEPNTGERKRAVHLAGAERESRPVFRRLREEEAFGKRKKEDHSTPGFLLTSKGVDSFVQAVERET